MRSGLSLCVNAAALLAAALLASCATTTTSSADQEKIEQEYQELQSQKAAIEQQNSTVVQKASKLFDRAGALEKSRGIALKRSACLVPEGMPIPVKGGDVGPVALDKKAATFRLVEKPSGSGAGMSVNDITLVPQEVEP
jgi:hypothetical protein